MFAAKSDTERSGRNRNHERSKCGRLRHTGPEDKQELIAPDDNVILRLGRHVRIVVSGQRNRLRVPGAICVQRLMRSRRRPAPLLQAAVDSPITRIALGGW